MRKTTKKSNFDKNQIMTRLYQCLLFILAATFLFSAYTKAIAPRFFEILLEQQGVVSNPFIGAWFTRAIIAVETALELPSIKIHCSVLAEDSIKRAIEDYESKQ